MPVQTVSSFLTVLRATVARGSSLDALLPSALHNALRYIEMNYNMKYMRLRTSISVLAASTNYTWTGDDSTNLKVVRDLYWYGSDGTKYDLRQVQPYEIESNTGSDPSGFYLVPEQQTDGSINHQFYFDAPHSEARTLRLQAYTYRGWNGNEAATNVWLLNNAEQLVLARCMIQLAPVMRDQAIMQMWATVFQDNLGAVLQAQDEMERGAWGSE